MGNQLRVLRQKRNCPLQTLFPSLVYVYHCAPQQMYLTPLMAVYQWWHWMKQARSESLGAAQHWDLVKWSLVTLCSTGEMEPPLTPLAQCLALVQPHTPSPTSILVQCMKWELHQWALLDWVDTAVGVGRKWWLTTVSEQQSWCKTNWLSFDILIVYW